MIACPTQSSYSSSKFAVRGFSENLKSELVTTPIGVSCVYPGGVRTNIIRNSRVVSEDKEEYKKTVEYFDTLKLTPQRIAMCIYKAVRKNKFRILIGKETFITDILTRLFPGQMAALIGKSWHKNKDKN